MNKNPYFARINLSASIIKSISPLFNYKSFKRTVLSVTIATLSISVNANQEAQTIPNKLLFGDTHLHTSYSLDAFLNKNQTVDPEMAYRWAKGAPMVHNISQAKIQIKTPLDFLVIADHAEGMGLLDNNFKGEVVSLDELGFLDSLKRWAAIKYIEFGVDNDMGLKMFSRFIPVGPENPGKNPVQDPNNNTDGYHAFGENNALRASYWNKTIDAAERNNDPGTFTTFAGWEWSSMPTGANLHRVIFTPDGADKTRQYLPFGADSSQYPEDLWSWLEKTSKETKSRFISIPHNSNVSRGFMFAETTLRGEVITADYAKTRIEWEPLVEVTQSKGDMEARGVFSPKDEFADFENFYHYLDTSGDTYIPIKNDFARGALTAGLAIEEKVGVNPFKFGMIGSTDSHTGYSSPEENNYWGKTSADSLPKGKKLSDSHGESPISFNGFNMSASGLTAVWAIENTREDIFNAFQRKEVYATTGTRLSVRVFAGWNMDEQAIQSNDFATYGYKNGVPMGGDLTTPSLTSSKTSPEFIFRAVKDPIDANLDRVQIIKGWISATGERHEAVYNVAWAGERKLDSTGVLPAVGSTVNLDNAQYTNTIGSEEIVGKWTDPDFNLAERAYYYVRVLQIPTPRNSLYDSLATQTELPSEGPATIQERAYSSPIWYTPK
ncbi:DUF3604 domain-containing protein [Colwellia demingiae]|uniref:DUF3604 domain-containing protein n=1 Tax=Colwellia demingiae TaxID=89401 RepID=A0A5C6QHJ2_9GAMM|nr:DUF3604 domain-containing protein [Colwellia demingiae]TWX68062.1 DUF3604 domain-containing protein [Colwellia demingiae]